eukprot:364550_1
MPSSENHWISRAKIPSPHSSKFAVAFDNTTNELYVIRQNIEDDGLFKYLFANDEWIKYTIEPPLNLKRHHSYRDCTAPTAAIITQKNLIYLHDDTFNAKIKLFHNKNHGKLEGIKCPWMGSAPNMTVINNECHIIGDNTHFKYNEHTNRFIFLGPICDSDSDNDIEIEWVENPGFANVKDRKILMFGGQNNDNEFEFNYTDSIYECDLTNNEYQWTKLDVKLPDSGYMGFGCTAILDGKYVLVMGGQGVEDGGGWATREIHIYSVPDQTFRKSKIICPEAGQFKAITVSDKKKDEIITFGYIRSVWKECDINDQLFPPQYLVRIISKYYFDEFVHLFSSSFDYNPGVHWKISVFDIIDQCSL